jgi:hypothetical protein
VNVAGLLRKRRAQLFFLRLRVFVQTPDVDRQLLLEQLGFFSLSLALRLADLVFEKQLLLRDASFESGIDFRDLPLLVVREGNARCLFLEALHRQFVR